MGILDGDLISETISHSPEALDDVHLGSMEIAVFAEPGVFDEIGCIDDECIALPVAHGISVVGRIGVRAMRAAIGWNDAVRIARHVLIEEDHFIWQLNDLARRAQTRDARSATEEN